MCGCSDDCKPARCPGCPETDWNSFTFRCDVPAADVALIWGTVERRIEAHSAAMIYPRTCPCLWQSYRGEIGRDISGAYNADSKSYSIASISTLTRVRSGSTHIWRYTISRYGWDWNYWNSLNYAFDNGWGWGPYGPYDDANGCANWGYGWGFGVYGYGGWGYGGYRYGFDPAYWYIPHGYVASYDLVGNFNCRGTSHFVRNDALYADYEEYVPDAYPAYVDVTRIARDTAA